MRVEAFFVAAFLALAGPGWSGVGAGSGALDAIRPAPAPLAAQEPSLDAVEERIDRGRISGARDALQTWWEESREGAPSEDRQRALWLRARLTVDPSLARVDYTRLALEHPGGPYSAGALLRLGQAAAAAGRPAEATRHFEQLLRDYPESPHRLEARRWLDRNRASISGLPEGDGAESEPPPTASAEPTPDGAPDGDPEAADRGAGGPYAVQLGAFSTPERAGRFVRSARARGVEGLRIVRVDGSDLVRVRAGAFARRDGAEALRDRFRERGVEAAVVEDADAEQRLR